jgi:hypothetical protein
MYFIGYNYLGSYSKVETVVPNSEYSANFGLDEYEAKFFHPIPEWLGYGDFNVVLKFDDDEFAQDLFYFCHIHQYMSGRIKLLKNGEEIQHENMPELGYEYEVPSDHDLECGTYGLNAFQIPDHAECPEQFVCDAENESEELQAFAKCIDSMNCAMMAGMSSSVSGDTDEVALFIHQMIPHHQNAVNMAKALLKTKKLQCDLAF